MADKKSKEDVKATKKKASKKKASKKKGSAKAKDAQFVLRLDREMRDRFVEICSDLDTSAAREVRRFIKRFIKGYEDGEMDE